MTLHRSNVSVVMPCHNGASYIEGALDSVARQTLQPDEVIVVLDSTTDDSGEQVRASGLPVKILHCDFKNAAAARNLGTQTASGKWLAFLDADDFWFPDYLKAATSALQQSSSVGFLTHHDAYYERYGKTVAREPVSLLEDEKPLTHRDFYKAFVGRNVGWPTSGMVVKRHRFEEIGGFDERQVRRHDADMFMRLIYGQRWMYRRRAGWTYRLRPSGNISSNQPECAYYLLRAMIKNEPAYQGPEMAAFIRRQAHLALSYNLRFENDETYRRVCELALERVSMPYRLVYGLARMRPAFFSSLLNVRHRYVQSTKLATSSEPLR